MKAEEYKRKKAEAKEFGEFCEEIAAQEYIRNGYTVKERGWRLGKIEIDLIAMKENVVVIVEVKARATDEEDALEAVNLAKRKRMIKAADAYLKFLPGDFYYRFDIVTFVGSKKSYEMTMHEDAFFATDIF